LFAVASSGKILIGADASNNYVNCFFAC